MTPVRIAALLFGLAFLAACGNKNDLQEPPAQLGDFALGLNIVVADQAQKSPVSRDAKPEEWKASLQQAIEDRFGRYDNSGTKLFNLGISIDGFALAPPGLPVLLKPRSLLVITANIWDDAAQKKLNAEGKRLIIFENTTGKTFIGSGLTQSKAEQMRNLSYNAAKAVEGWLLDNPEWFGLPPKPKQEEATVKDGDTRGSAARRVTQTAAPATAAPATAAPVAASAGTSAAAVTASPSVGAAAPAVVLPSDVAPVTVQRLAPSP